MNLFSLGVCVAIALLIAPVSASAGESPTEEEAKAAWKTAGIHVEFRQSPRSTAGARLDGLRTLEIGCPNGWFVRQGRKPLSISNHCVRALNRLASLELLRIGHLNMSDLSFASLGDSPSLSILHVSRAPVTDAGLDSFKETAPIQSLQFSDCKQISRKAVERLSAKTKAQIEIFDDGRQVGIVKSGTVERWAR